MKSTSLLALITSVLLVSAVQAASSASTPPTSATTANSPAQMRIMDNVVRVGVNGMTCADCKKQVESELGQLRDNPKYKSRIKEIAVDLKGKTATIRMIETVKLSAQERDELTKDVADAITKAGYEPVLMAPRPNRM